MIKKYKVIPEEKLTKINGGWGYSLVFRNYNSWQNKVLKWFKG